MMDPQALRGTGATSSLIGEGQDMYKNVQTFILYHIYKNEQKQLKIYMNSSHKKFAYLIITTQ